MHGADTDVGQESELVPDSKEESQPAVCETYEPPRLTRVGSLRDVRGNEISGSDGPGQLT